MPLSTVTICRSQCLRRCRCRCRAVWTHHKFIENPIECSHWVETKIKENTSHSHSLSLSVNQLYRWFWWAGCLKNAVYLTQLINTWRYHWRGDTFDVTWKQGFTTSIYLRSCSPRFTGMNCESPVDLCDNHGCGSNAVCSPDFSRLSHVCLCNQDHRPAPGENSTRPGNHCPIYEKGNESNNFLDVCRLMFALKHTSKLRWNRNSL